MLTFSHILTTIRNLFGRKQIETSAPSTTKYAPSRTMFDTLELFAHYNTVAETFYIDNQPLHIAPSDMITWGGDFITSDYGDHDEYSRVIQWCYVRIPSVSNRVFLWLEGNGVLHMPSGTFTHYGGGLFELDEYHIQIAYDSMVTNC